MEDLDLEYITGLVKQAKQKDSNALAELYAATYQRCYRFGCRYLKNKEKAREALQETYILAFKSIGSLNDPRLFVSWLNRIMFRICFRLKRQSAGTAGETSSPEDTAAARETETDTAEKAIISIDGRDYPARQVMGLPASESQALIHYYYDRFRITEIARLMEIRPSDVKRYIRSGREKLGTAAAH